MLGGLHTEMALWKTTGDLLEGSGWTEALTEGEVVSSGVAESFLKATHLTRTRHGHQMTLLANLQREAFMLCEGPKDEVCTNVEKWNGTEESNFRILGSDFKVRNLHSHFRQGSQREELSTVRASIGEAHTTVFLPWIMLIIQDGCQSISGI